VSCRAPCIACCLVCLFVLILFDLFLLHSVMNLSVLALFASSAFLAYVACVSVVPRMSWSALPSHLNVDQYAHAYIRTYVCACFCSLRVLAIAPAQTSPAPLCRILVPAHTHLGMAASAAKSAASAACPESIAEVAEAARLQWGGGVLQNISLDMLGVAPWNRGRLGVSYYHVQDILSSISVDGCSRQRYRDVQVVRVPPSELDAFKQFNKDILAACPELPPFSEQMKFACLTKRLGRSSYDMCVRTYVRTYAM
jgi:hypothetical protein